MAAGRYEILRPIGAGGMAELFLARARGEGGFARLVVVKRILPHLARDESFVAMFLNEARIAATLQHPNLVTVTDFGQQDGDYFLTMEYVHGADLGELLESAAAADDLPLEVALTIVHGACAGLHHAHEKAAPDGHLLHLVHRDVSPHNVMVSFDGSVKVTDFGIATATALTRTTRAGTIKGKVSYMAPEQCKGLQIDRRADVFALGILLYETTLLTRLFVADNDYALMTQVIEGRVPPPRSLDPEYPASLQAIVLRALALAPEDRFPSAEALQVAIERFAVERRLRLSPIAVAQWVLRRLGPRPWPILPREVAIARRPAASDASDDAPARAKGAFVGLAIAAVIVAAGGAAWAIGDREPAPAPASPMTQAPEPEIVVIPSPTPVPTATPEAAPSPPPEDEPVVIDDEPATGRRPGRRAPKKRVTQPADSPRYDLDEAAPPR